MNFDSETLITSFFPRITKKRGIHTDSELAPSSSSNKRQRGYTTTTASHSHGTNRANGHRNTLDNGIISISNSPSVETTQQQISERHMSLLPSLNAKNATSQKPKPNRSSSRTKRKTSPLTPIDGAAERQRLMELTPILPPFISRKSLGLRIDKASLSTPSTLAQSTSYHNGHAGNERSRVNQGQVLLTPTRLKRSDTSLTASVPVSIASSQSQLMVNAYCEDKHPLLPASTALPCKKQSPQFEVQPSPPNRIILNRKGDSASHDSQMFISSSQSQFLSPLDEHDHPQPSLIGPNSELDIIPSSQSQEKELRILNDLEESHQSIRSRKQAIPQRTLSDELFSVSILHTGWSDCPLDFKQPIQGTADIPCVAKQGDDSVTESESEPETKKKDPYYRDHCLAPIQSQPYEFSQLSTADIASLNEDSIHKDSRNSQQSSQVLSFADQTSSIASLPSAVKEFQSMFGSDDESYPADFPMSLR